jgi:UDP-N-acetylmuramoyl-L-alanyl-D-glutamate--2,6-diaminopimelate ligase
MRFSYSISRNLSECLKDIIQIDNDTIITGITSNSADVKDGYLFCALSDKANEYISDAIVNGASVIIANNIKENLPESVLKIIYATPKDVYHKICSNFYKKQPKHISAVTGTNGKTSVCYFFQQICNLTNKKAASIGTLGLVINNEIFEENLLLTSPNASKLHSLLYNLYCNDINYVALEASSHGLDQQRMHSVKLESAVFTNLSHDHLDYHNDMESYFKAKLKLFTEILPSIGNVILNIDDEYSHRIKSLIKQKNIITYGSRNADIQILEQNPTPCGQNIKIKAFNKFLEVKLNIFGKFQAYNLLAAVGLALANGVDIYKID